MSGIPPITIAMVGPRGVGKTSLLAAMYRELDAELEKLHCTLVTSPGPTQEHILSRQQELENIAVGGGKITVNAADGVDGTAEQREYTFHLDVSHGGDPELVLRFVDLPGGWYTGQGNFGQADELLGNAHVSLLAVDATALVEGASQSGPGKYHNQINAPKHIREAYKRALSRLNEDHVVVLTLIRAETYLQKNPNREAELFQRAQEAYCDLASSLAQNRISQVPIYACAVETVGSLIFNRFSEINGAPVAEFYRQQGRGYSPSRCAEPLRLALRFGLQKAMDEAFKDIAKKRTFFNWLRKTFGGKDEHAEAKRKADAIRSVFDKINESEYRIIHPLT